MKNIDEIIRTRRSVRTYNERMLTAKHIHLLNAFTETLDNPYGIPIEFRILNGEIEDLHCPVVVGTKMYIGAKMKRAAHFNEAIGYSFEKLALYAHSLGIGTVLIGGTMERSGFERAMKLQDDEVMPLVSPLGYPSEKMSFRETLMRKGIKADDHLPFEKLFFDNSFDVPLTLERADQLKAPLESVRFAPSAVNRQPWRVVVSQGFIHFFLKRTKAFGGGILDMQKMDAGIALCHFELSAKESGMNPTFLIDAPSISIPDGLEYIASYAL